MRKRFVEFIVPIAIAAIFALLNITPFFQTAEQRIFDLFLHIKPAIPERAEILLLDIDDTAIKNVGLFPWSRDYMARGLISLREFEAEYVTFDVEYVDPSPQTVDGNFLQTELPEVFDANFAGIVDQIDALFGALAAGQIPVADAPEFVDQWAQDVNYVQQGLLSTVGSVVQDNDAFLGRAARFHGTTYFTVNILDYDELAPQDEEAEIDKATVVPIGTVDLRSVRPGEDIRPTISPVLAGGKGAGFPNVVVDSDGVRRRIDLLAAVDDQYFAQLVTAPLLDWLGNPDITVGRDNVVLGGARIPGAEDPVTITIPLAPDGRMLINWPKAEYTDSFRHISYWRLVFDWEKEEEMLELLRSIAPNLDRYYVDSDQLLPLYDFAEGLKEDVLAGGDRAQIEQWREYRSIFFETLGDFLGSEVLDWFLTDVQAAIDSGEYEAAVIPQLQAIADETDQLFRALSERFDQFWNNRLVLMDELPGSFVIIGLVGTSTTDIGVTPFDEEYMNVGPHASVVNTILQQQFLDSLPWPLSLALMFIVSILVTLLISRLEPTPSLVIGFGAVFVVMGGVVALFLLTGIYVNLVTPVVGLFLTLVVLTAIKFIRENRQKMEVRNAFGHYMSEEVVKQVTEDPSKLALGGDRKEITAIFTDVQGFSTISEALEPEQLVHLLNRYLSEMCDIILNEQGTIDKFEGDAIIAFFGAPIDMEDHAVKCCRAAIQMKKLEEQLNKEFLAEEMSPTPLLTRIGVNSGDMVVGNMGTATRMDYTMMGHNVNLAARLEGVNKQYGTWILASEQTYSQTGRTFSARKLDRVRVVGITEPVRLYELIDLREDVDGDQNLIDKLRTFNTGLTAFEGKEWAEAEKNFKTVLDEYPEDGPAKYYLDRARKFKKTPPSPDWDGVFNLTKK